MSELVKFDIISRPRDCPSCERDFHFQNNDEARRSKENKIQGDSDTTTLPLYVSRTYASVFGVLFFFFSSPKFIDGKLPTIVLYIASFNQSREFPNVSPIRAPNLIIFTYRSK